MDPNELRLLAEQMGRTIDLLRCRQDALEARLRHETGLHGMRLNTLEASQADQEARLRAVTDAVARLMVSTSLAQAAQAALALLLSAIAAWLGSR